MTNREPQKLNMERDGESAPWKKVKLRFYHGGTLIRSPTMSYVNGKMEVLDHYDVEEICYWTLLSMVHRLKYGLNKVKRLYFLEPGMTLDKGLKLLFDDNSVIELSNHLEKLGEISIYVDHVGDSDCKTAKVPLPKAFFETTDESSDEGISDENDSENEKDNKNRKGNDEELNIEDMNWFSDEEDNELASARKKLKKHITDMERLRTETENVDDDHVGAGPSTTPNARPSIDDSSEHGNVSPSRGEGDGSDHAHVGPYRGEGDGSDHAYVSPSRGEGNGSDHAHVSPSRGEGDGLDHAHVGPSRGDCSGHGDAVSSMRHAFDDGGESEYIESDDPGSYLTTSDESDADDAQRVQSRCLSYNPSVGIQSFFVGQIFKDSIQFKAALNEYSLQNRFCYSYKKNDKVRVRAKCAAIGCQWEILASRHGNDNSFRVKTYISEHSCLPTTQNKRVTAKIIATKFGDEIAKMPFMKGRHIRALVKQKLGVTVNIWKARRAKLRVMKKIQEKYIEEFSRLREYADELCDTNPGSTVKVEVDRSTLDSPPIFHRMYICFKAIKDNFKQGCRPIIGFDGCFLKGVVRGQLLVAVGRDGNNQMFPIAWAVIASLENIDNWKWFLELLMDDLEIVEGVGWTVISDMQKGLLRAVNDLLPFAEQRMCARHIYARWGKRFREPELKLLFWVCARSPNQQQFLKHMEVLKTKDQAAHDYLKETWNPLYWSQAFFSDICKCDVIDNNMCEAFNGVIVDARCKPIISMLEDIRVYVMKRLVKNRQLARNWKNDHGPRILARLEKSRLLASRWEVNWNGGLYHEVFQENTEDNSRESYTVCLSKSTCSCRGWDISGIPCPHAFSAIIYEGDDPKNHLDPCFRRDEYLKAYEHMLHPVKGPMFWPKTNAEVILPSALRKKLGRPQKQRKREELEGRKKTTMSRVGRKMKCGICHQEGHNRTKCPMLPDRNNSNPPILQKRKRKALDSALLSLTPTTGSEPSKKKHKRKNQHVHSVLNVGRLNQLVVSSGSGSISVITTNQLLEVRQQMENNRRCKSTVPQESQHDPIATQESIMNFSTAPLPVEEDNQN